MPDRTCDLCKGPLTPSHREARFDWGGDRPVRVLLPTWRCDRCHETSGEVMACPVAGEHPPTLVLITRPWRRHDRQEATGPAGEGDPQPDPACPECDASHRPW